jgi:class 3 adenylate cyclase
MTNLFDHLQNLISRDIHPTEREAEIWERYGSTVAAMVIDSSGFSRVTEQHGIVHFLSQLMLMRSTIRNICDGYRCHAFRFEADNVYAIFDQPNDAVHAARRVHEVIHEKEIMLTPLEPFRVCIGIGFGKMLYSETLEGYFGEEMNLASKLGEDTAIPGETLITQSVFQNTDGELLKGFTARPLRIAGIETICHGLRFQPGA